MRPGARASSIAIAAALTVGACASEGGTRAGVPCQSERKQGMCEVDTTIDPRESESPDEAATLIVTWSWLGPKVPGDVPAKVTEFHLTASEARGRAKALDDLGKSRCVLEQAFAPAECAGQRRIVAVEAALIRAARIR